MFAGVLWHSIAGARRRRYACGGQGRDVRARPAEQSLQWVIWKQFVFGPPIAAQIARWDAGRFAQSFRAAPWPKTLPELGQAWLKQSLREE